MEKTSTSGVIMFHPDLAMHDVVASSPEGGRISLIIDQLIVDGLWGENVCQADLAPLKRLRDIHDEEFLNDLHRRTHLGVAALDPRTPVMEKSFEIARYSTGEVLDAVDLIMEGEISTAFCLTAMPGHHAGTKSFGGGCLVNHVAAGAQYLSKKYQLKRIAILDFDAAHGNGTQEIFWKRRDVLFISIHEYPGFPGTGHYSEAGEHPSKGMTVNLPFPSGYGDREYAAAFKEIILPILKQFSPEFIFLSWSPNTLQDDPYAHLVMSEQGLLNLLKEVIAVAKAFSKGRLISVLEGGTPGKAMARVVSQHVSLLLNNRCLPVDKGKKVELVSYADWYSYSKVLKTEFKKYWRI